MRKRDSAGLSLAPLFLRLALAVTFIWAGLGKFMARDEVQGEQAAILANYGLIPMPAGSAGTALPRSEAMEQPLWLPTSFQPEDTGQDEDIPSEEQDPEQGEGETETDPQEAATPSRVLATAADFPDPIPVPRRVSMVLLLHDAIHPGLDPEDSSPLMPLWPDLDPQTDYDMWPPYFALAVAVTEVVAGILIAIGLLTRLSALSIAGVMAGAVWLTTIGPAVQSGQTSLGFLPNHGAYDMAWSVPLWQFALVCVATALFFSGPGALSLDRLLVGGPKKPAPAKPKPKPGG